MAWFRLHTDIIDDEKVAKMSEKTFKTFLFLLAYARELNEKGAIKKSISELEWRLRINKKQLEKAIKELCELKIIDKDSEGLHFINFQKRQYDPDYLRLKKHRNKKRNDNANDNGSDNTNDNANDNGHETLHPRAHARNTETETNTPPIVPPKGDVVNSFPSDGIPYAEILQDLVEKAGIKIDFTAEATLRRIRVLWRKGYTLEDFRHVNTVKSAQWANDVARRQWLHPNTLYKDDKFDVYRNEEAPIIEGQEPWRF